MEFVGWRCVQCGAIVDPVILGNRIDRPVPAVSRVRRTFTW